MSATPKEILRKLNNAEQRGVDMASPKAVVDYMLAQGEKQSILYFYKPNSLEFDFGKFNNAVAEMRGLKK
ncbi:hypothetical protein [Planomicrobium sp. CPCC 101110]|uniref:hypothetical protein n=1 Tax=Planomicrobium sp. CPCC 101110 TaxID=2599619 RepID=UPI0011B82E86|nr:hypothetical protein [Planomicrobium sp. CPCC 101110]TWT28359.1 hypothetical protein FQV30_07605 [Planomicrobium sp. CPCC 101110]